MKMDHKNITIKMALLFVILLISNNNLYAQLNNCHKDICMYKFSDEIEINCFLFIKESNMRKERTTIEEVFNITNFKGLDSMRYALNIFELDTNNNKANIGYTFQVIGGFVPNSDNYLLHYFPVTHIYTLKAGYKMMVTIDKKVNLKLAESMLKIRKIEDSDTLLFRECAIKYNRTGELGIAVYFKSNNKHQTIIKNMWGGGVKGYEKYFSAYSLKKIKKYNEAHKNDIRKY
jgi:tRNA(His) 5'-end guanylyltransferase